ncbi:MAG: glycerate kinase, partial [Firmicutes bacterium]|nr:glycerate kinase [Bacillota bacterium]
TAVIEMAQASGLTLVPPNKMNPLVTTSYGTGELIKYGLDLGCTRFIVGLGGSATNDGGLGMGQALGFSFLDQEGKPLGFGGGELVRLAKIETGGADLRLSQADFEVAADVQNVLTGPTGASYVYGPQKGGTPAQLELLDGALENYGRILKRDLGRDVAAKPGAGAAGGLGAGLMALLNAEIRSGIELILDLFDFSQKARGAQLVLTGEGRLDAQSAYGKVPLGVGRRCRALGVPAVALAGTVLQEAEILHQEGISAYFSICGGPLSLEQAINSGAELLENQAAQVLRLFLAAAGN